MGLAVPLLWGMGIVFAKAAIEHFPPILLMALRFSLTALVLVWFVKVPRGLMLRLVLIAFIASAVQYSLTFNGLKGLDASTAALVVQAEVPFLVLLGAFVLGEKPSPRKWVGIAAAFLGVGVIYGEPNLRDSWIYLFMCLGGAFFWAIGQAMIRRWCQHLDGFTMIAWISVMAAPQLWVFSFALESDHLALLRGAGWVVWGTVVYLGLIMTALGYGLWYTLVARHPISRVGPFLLLLPVTSILGAVLLLGESLTLHTALGGAIVIAGVAFIVMEREKIPKAGAASGKT